MHPHGMRYGFDEIQALIQLAYILVYNKLNSFFQDFNLPAVMWNKPAVLQTAATKLLQDLLKRRKMKEETSEAAEESFHHFTAVLSHDYPAEAVTELVHWFARHGVDHDYWVGLSNWFSFLSFLAGIERYGDTISVSSPAYHPYNIYQTVTLGDSTLRATWVENRELAVRQHLEREALEHDDASSALFPSQRVLDIVWEILREECAYRFLLNVRQCTDTAARATFVESAARAVSNLGDSHIEKFVAVATSLLG